MPIWLFNERRLPIKPNAPKPKKEAYEDVAPKCDYPTRHRGIQPRDYAASFSISSQPVKGIPKLIAQVGDLISRHRIRTRLQQCLKSVLNNLEVDLAQLVFFHGGTPDKAASVIRSRRVPLSGLTQKLGQLGDIRRNPPRFVFGEQLGGRMPAGFPSEV
jgi:hypothetical protein